MIPTPNRPGTPVDEFILDTETGQIRAEIRLVTADGGTEILHHYENGILRFSHRALRCTDCNTLLIDGHIGRRCLDCATAGGHHIID